MSIKHPRVPTEHVEQVAYVNWFRLQYRDVRLVAIPNGGSRHPIEASNLVDEGVAPGVPDLFVPAWLFWIEMKRLKGSKTSAAQLDWRDYLNTIGHTSIIARGFHEARERTLEFVEQRNRMTNSNLITGIEPVKGDAC